MREVKNKARKAAKAQRPPEGRQVRIRRGGREVDHNFFAPRNSAGQVSAPLRDKKSAAADAAWSTARRGGPLREKEKYSPVSAVADG